MVDESSSKGTKYPIYLMHVLGPVILISFLFYTFEALFELFISAIITIYTDTLLFCPNQDPSTMSHSSCLTHALLYSTLLSTSLSVFSTAYFF